MTSPICLINDASTETATSVTPGSTVTIRLQNTAGVSTWEVTCYTTSDLIDTDDVNSTYVLTDLPNRIAQFTIPNIDGVAMLFKSTVNNGLDSNGRTRSDYITTFKVYTPINQLEVAALNETTESGPTGWLSLFNRLVRSGSAGVAAPSNAQYLVLQPNSTLTDERVFTNGAGIATTDAGAGGALTIRVNDTVVPFLSGNVKFTGPLTASLGVSASFINLGDRGTGVTPNSGLIRIPYAAAAVPVVSAFSSTGAQKTLFGMGAGDAVVVGPSDLSLDLNTYGATYLQQGTTVNVIAGAGGWNLKNLSSVPQVTLTPGTLFTVSVPISASNGMSGSLTRVAPNLPYLLTQGTITATTNSLGQIILSGSGGSGGSGLIEPLTASLGVSASFFQGDGRASSYNMRFKYGGSQNVLQLEQSAQSEVWRNVIARSSTSVTLGDTSWWDLNLYSYNVNVWGAGSGGGTNFYNQPGSEIGRVRDNGWHFGSTPLSATPSHVNVWFSGSRDPSNPAERKHVVFAGDVVSSASISFVGVGNGTSPTAGLLRVPYNAGVIVPIVKVLDSTAAEKNMLRWGAGDTFYIGDTSRTHDLNLFGSSCNQNVVTMLFTVGAGGFKIEDFSSVGYFFGGGATGKVDQRLYLSSSKGVLSGSDKFRVVIGDTVFSGTVVEQVVNGRNKKWSYIFETSTTDATPKQIFQWTLPSGSSRVTVTADYCRANVSSAGSFTKMTLFRNNAGTCTQDTVVGGIDGGTLLTSGSTNGLSIDLNGTTARLYLTGTASAVDTWQIDMQVNEIKPA